MPELYLRKVVADLIPLVGDAKRISGLRITFNVEKTVESEPNKARIEIYNLSPETRGFIEAKGMRVALSVGYEGFDPQGGNRPIPFSPNSTSSVESIFIGDVEKVVHRFRLPDIVTTIEAKDGGNRYKNARIDRGFPPHTTLRKIITEMDLSLGLARGRIQDIPDFSYANGMTFSGPVKEHLDVVCPSFDLQWSIQDESLQIIANDQTLDEQSVFLNVDTGLIGYPSKTDSGVEFDMLVQPKVRPGRAIQLESKYISGVFKPYRVIHKGDSFGGDFMTSVETAKRPKKKERKNG